MGAVRYIMKKDLGSLEAVDRKQAMEWTRIAWEQVKKETIVNCFRHTGLFEDDGNGNDITEAANKEDMALSEELRDLIKQVHGDDVDINDVEIVPLEEKNVHAVNSFEEIVNRVIERMQSDREGMRL